MDFDNTQGVGEGVETPTPGDTDSAVPASLSNEPSAATNTTDLNTGVEGSPTSTDVQLTEAEGEKPDASQPVAELTEQEIQSLAPKAAQAFARFRTENKGLSEEVTT